MIHGESISHGPITQRPEGTSQREWVSFRNEVGSFPGMKDKIGTRDVLATIAIETFNENEVTPPITAQTATPPCQVAGDNVL